MVSVILLYLAGINLATFAAFAADKRSAQSGRRRVPERTLLTLAALGGTPAAFMAMESLRHKTRKQPFGTYLWLIGLGQAALAAGFAALAWR
jgi:uncharacterized membrane protein YsdA (DUF1294 family)